MRKTIILSTIAAALVSCTSIDNQSLTVVPYPNEVEINAGSFNVAGAGFHYSAEFDEATKNIINNMAAQLSLVTGIESATDENAAGEGFVFILDKNIPEEAYELTVSKKAATVKASSLRGVNYAVQTIKQMLPVEIFGKTAAADKVWSLPCVEISDAPRFGYRGMHLDVSRHFFDMDMVKKYLDIMEVHKLNTLHWHLTDDQGWRIEIKKYPKLTEVGSIRKETIIGHQSRFGAYDGTPYGEGFWYTQDQIKEIIDYAAAKGIDVVPEIDLPGHMLAALAAYPEFGCTGGPYDVWGRWGVADDVLCAGNEKAMKFLEDVILEVADLFPYKYFHIGGDECPKVRWEKCPKCQAKIKELGLEDGEKYKAEHYLQSYVMNRMAKVLETKGKKVIGWDEILEGEVSNDLVVMSWRGASGGLEAARQGKDAIMTPNSHFYLDYYQSADVDTEPLGIGGYLPIDMCYSFEPYVDGMSDEEKAHIIGVQANLWTEYIATNEHLEYMLLPRMAALSEVQWCQSENKSWMRFKDNADELCRIYDVMGYNYATQIFDTAGEVNINKETGRVEVTLDGQGGVPIRYTLDGSEPTEESALYTGPIEITESCVLTAKSLRDDYKARPFKRTFEGHKAMGRLVKVTNEPHGPFVYNCPDQLTDGLRSKGSSYRSGEFVGWYAKPFEAVIEMEGESYNTVTLSTIENRYDHIFGPVDMTISTSEDGEEYTEVAHADYEIKGGIHDGFGLREFTLTFPETTAKYLKVTANHLDKMPVWHEGNGHPSFIFVDEVIVK